MTSTPQHSWYLIISPCRDDSRCTYDGSRWEGIKTHSTSYFTFLAQIKKRHGLVVSGMALWEFRGNIQRLYSLDIHLSLTEILPSFLMWLWWNSPAAAHTKTSIFQIRIWQSENCQTLNCKQDFPKTLIIAANAGPCRQVWQSQPAQHPQEALGYRSQMNTCHSNSLFFPTIPSYPLCRVAMKTTQKKNKNRPKKPPKRSRRL